MHQIFDKNKIEIIKSFLMGNIPKDLPKSTYYKYRKLYNKENGWRVEKDVLFFGNKICIPQEEVKSALEATSKNPMWSTSSVTRFWKRLNNDFAGITLPNVEKFMSTKRTVQILKKESPLEVTPIITTAPKQQFQADFVNLEKFSWANLGYGQLLTVIDHFSKFAFVFPMKSRDLLVYAQAFELLFKEGEIPATIHCDNEFRSNALQELCDKYKVKLIFSPGYLPRSNGCIVTIARLFIFLGKV